MVTAANRRRIVRARAAALALLAPALAILAALPTSARAAPGDHKYLVVRGRVADPSGAPLPGVRVEARGSTEATAITDDDGRYSLSIDLGTLGTLRAQPFGVSIRGRRDGWRVRLPGAQPALVIEVSIHATADLVELVARSNFGLIAGAVVDALAPTGERTAVIQVTLIGESGAESDSTVELAAERRAVAIDEPWMLAPTTPSPASPPAASGGPAPAPSTAGSPARAAPPPAPSRAASPPTAPSAGPARARRVPRPAPPAPAGSPGAARAREESLRVAMEARGNRGIAAAAQRDSAERAALALAQARRDSTWRVQRQTALRLKAQADSARAARDAIEDSTRRARFHLTAPVASRSTTAATPRASHARSAPATAGARPGADSSAVATTLAPAAPTPPRPVVRAPAAAAPKPSAAKSREAGPARSNRGEGPPVAQPVTSQRANPIGLQRVTPGVRPESLALSENAVSPGTAGASCACRIRGTVELEFHHLLSSPMRVEVTVPELALRDTVELFMGSPREFVFEQVPCGRYSLTVRPFSTRRFDVVTPEAIAPFDCAARGLRQVRVVLDPR
jgi:hypothetical protein